MNEYDFQNVGSLTGRTLIDIQDQFDKHQQELKKGCRSIFVTQHVVSAYGAGFVLSYIINCKR